MSKRDEIIVRSAIFYVAVAIAALSVAGRIVYLQVVEGEKWASMGESFVYRKDAVKANRGDILAADGRILASSVPYYSVYIDTRSTGMPDSVWNNGLEGLASGLSRLFGDKSAAAWRSELNGARNRGERYYLLRRRVSHNELKELRQLPIARHGRFRGGLIVQPEERRVLPHGSLAARTIGYITESSSGNVVGIEGAYDTELSGRDGIVVMQRLTGGDWLPLNDKGVVRPRDGYDIVSTIDIDLQDVAHTALLRQLSLHNARHGTAILMEVRTGDVKAIVNLEQGSDGRYYERYNYAVGESTEPGSTFKLPVLMAVLEEGVFKLNDTIDTGNGRINFYNATIRDSREGGYGAITLREVFEYSSNVGTAIAVTETFGQRPSAFVDRLYSMRLNERILDGALRGEGTPVIRYPGDQLWSGLSLPMMSHGYEVQQTPLQILTFYNAVANDGRMVRPRFVRGLSYKGSMVREYPVEVISSAIASRSTIREAREMLEGVVRNGTASNLLNDNYSIAGKTGTAQIANLRYGYRQGAGVSYQASFVGYFPADEPLYSAIVVVNAPSNSVYYGNLVAGPVFKEIADRVYSNYFFRNPATIALAGNGNSSNSNNNNNNKSSHPPVTLIAGGYASDFEIVAGMGRRERNSLTSPFVVPVISNDTIAIQPVMPEKGVVPEITGFSLRDALYILESNGWNVRFTGRGRVTRQSPGPGSRLREGATVYIELGI